MMLRKYETLFITKPDLPEESMEKVKARITGAIKKAGGVEIAYQDWGKRKMAYSIQKLAKGVYVYTRYLGNGATVAEIEHQLKVLDDVMRYMTIVLEDRIEVDTFDVEEDRKTIYPFAARPRPENEYAQRDDRDQGDDRREDGDMTDAGDAGDMGN